MIRLVAAYDRKYNTLDEAKADWIAGKDFKIIKGPYCSIRDTEAFKAIGYNVVLFAGDKLQFSEIVIKGN